MALKLLNPGLRPLGMFDLADTAAGTLDGGEYVQLAADTGDVEGYAADVPIGPLADGHTVRFAPGQRAIGSLGGLADEGEEEYGTLFGSLIGQRTGQATQVAGAVVLGPSTDRASGKVTVWAQAGLYGVSGLPATGATNPIDALSANDPVHSDSDGLLCESTDPDAGDRVGLYVGALTDTSLVSTTATAVGETTTVESHAIFYQGNAAPAA